MRTKRRGATLLETAIISPLLITVVLGAVDFGRFAYYYSAVTNAAREGAAYGSSHNYTPATRSAWDAEVAAAALAEMETAAGFDLNQIVVEPPTVVSDTNGQKSVRVEVQYPFRTLVPWPLLPNETTLARAVEMRCIR